MLVLNLSRQPVMTNVLINNCINLPLKVCYTCQLVQDLTSHMPLVPCQDFLQIQLNNIGQL